MGQIIEPKILRGFRDFLPENENVRKTVISKLEKVFTLCGFLPIDTPALEYVEILLGKSGGETEKQVYRFLDQGNRDVALRYDLTVPFARFMAQHKQELTLPFKRFHIAKVWRGEKPHKGRYREFMQCDFDLVGVDSASADFEILLVIYRSLKALNIDKFTINISHRGILSEYISGLGLSEQRAEVLRIIDKLGKIGEEEVYKLLTEIIPATAAKDIMILIRPENTYHKTSDKLCTYISKDSPHLKRIDQIFRSAEELGIASSCYFNTSITRGLDYYTGVVFETYLNDLPEIGSICSGGRYDNLVSLFSKEPLPGVGASIGLDRLLAALNELKTIPAKIKVPVLMILCVDEELTAYYHKLAEIFRDQGIATEVFPEKKKLSLQFTVASKKNIPFALICGGEEKDKEKITIKDINTRKSYTEITIPDALSLLKNQINA
jgi:histidyl-tRNA synthetase